MEIISEETFRKQFVSRLDHLQPKADYCTGPGRSGAVAAVYASHHLGIPFVPYKCKAPGKGLVVDTATMSGRTIRKASRRYNNAETVVAFDQKKVGHRLKFWYEELSMKRGKGNEYNP